MKKKKGNSARRYMVEEKGRKIDNGKGNLQDEQKRAGKKVERNKKSAVLAWS